MSEARYIKDAEGDVWSGNDEIGWTFGADPDNDSWLANENQLFIIWGPLTYVDKDGNELDYRSAR